MRLCACVYVCVSQSSVVCADRELKQTLETLLEDAEPVAHEPIVSQSSGAFDKLFADAQNMKV